MWYNVWSYDRKKYDILGFIHVKKPSKHPGNTTNRAFKVAQKRFPDAKGLGVSLSNKEAVDDLIGRFPPDTWEIIGA